jgi:hypothetical protein
MADQQVSDRILVERTLKVLAAGQGKPEDYVYIAAMMDLQPTVGVLIAMGEKDIDFLISARASQSRRMLVAARERVRRELGLSSLAMCFGVSLAHMTVRFNVVSCLVSALMVVLWGLMLLRTKET